MLAGADGEVDGVVGECSAGEGPEGGKTGRAGFVDRELFSPSDGRWLLVPALDGITNCPRDDDSDAPSRGLGRRMLGFVAGGVAAGGVLPGCGILPSAPGVPGGTPKSWDRDTVLVATVVPIFTASIVPSGSGASSASPSSRRMPATAASR